MLHEVDVAIPRYLNYVIKLVILLPGECCHFTSPSSTPDTSLIWDVTDFYF